MGVMMKTHRNKYKNMEKGVFQKFETNFSSDSKIIFYTLSYDNKLNCDYFFSNGNHLSRTERIVKSISRILWWLLYPLLSIA